MAWRGKQGQLEAAADSYRQAVRLRPDLAHIRNNLGLVFVALGELARAEACFREALSLQPDYPKARNSLAGVLTQRGKTEEAIALCRQAVKPAPQTPKPITTWGPRCLEQGDLIEAEDSFRQALRLQPDFAMARNNLACLFTRRAGWPRPSPPAVRSSACARTMPRPTTTWASRSRSRAI